MNKEQSLPTRFGLLAYIRLWAAWNKILLSSCDKHDMLFIAFYIITYTWEYTLNHFVDTLRIPKWTESFYPIFVFQSV